jgi:hypothetical protein
MGSELVRGLLLAGVRGVRREEGDAGVFLGAGVDGAIVAPSKLASSPSRVASVSGSTASPHEEQNLPLAETCAPHFVQNMGDVDFTIGPGPTANVRGGA